MKKNVLGSAGCGLAGSVEWGGLPGLVPVVFEIWVILTSFKEKKALKIAQNLTKSDYDSTFCICFFFYITHMKIQFFPTQKMIFSEVSELGIDSMLSPDRFKKPGIVLVP